MIKDSFFISFISYFVKRGKFKETLLLWSNLQTLSKENLRKAKFKVSLSCHAMRKNLSKFECYNLAVFWHLDSFYLIELTKQLLNLTFLYWTTWFFISVFYDCRTMNVQTVRSQLSGIPKKSSIAWKRTFWRSIISIGWTF